VRNSATTGGANRDEDIHPGLAVCAQNEAGNRGGNASNQRRRPARHGSGIAVRAFGTRPEDESRHRYQKHAE
jgi:hypothetical protein